MKRWPITYEKISNQENYSHRGLHLLSPQLKNLSPLDLSADEQRQEAIARVGQGTFTPSLSQLVRFFGFFCPVQSRVNTILILKVYNVKLNSKHSMCLF